MRVRKLEIEDILGIQSLVLEPGALTLIEGANGAGKTSVLEAVRGLLRGGHDPSLLRKGARIGGVRATLEDGTIFKKSVTLEKSELTVTEPQKGKLSRAQAFVDSQVDELGIDPMAIVTCPASKRAAYLEEVMPIRVEADLLEPLIGRKLTAAEKEGNALDLIDTERERLYDDRTGINRVAKGMRATVSQLRETLPPAEEVPEDPAALRAEASSIEGDRANEVRNAKTKSEHDVALVESKLKESERAEAKLEDEEVAKIRLHAEQAIEQVRGVGRKRAQKKNAEARARIDEVRSAEAAALEAIEEKFRPPLADLAEKITKAETRRDEWARAEKTREIIAASEKDAAKAESRSAALTHAIDELDALRASLLEQLPIPGLEIREGQVFVDGVSFERINRARQIEIAVRIAQLRAGPLGLIVIDDLEHLDAESFKAFEAAAEAADLQFIAAKVSDGPLTARIGR